MQLPETKMTGEEQDTLPLRIGQPHALIAFVFRARHHLLGRERAEGHVIQQYRAEMHEGAACDGAPLGRGLVRKALLELADRYQAMLPVDQLEGASNLSSPRVHDRLRQAP